MKNFIAIILLSFFLPFLLKSQTQRMVMYEGFSQASCPPCATANPGINNLLNSNEDKVVAIKYQTNWPGADPMNTPTQTWVGPRVTYYGVNAVPASRTNGVNQTFNQTNIDNQYAIPSPFYMTVEHSFNPSRDSVTVTCEITAAQDFSGTQMVCHIAMIEKVIEFDNAPGTNGEKVFHRVMRRMYPNANGTAIKDDWTNGESQIIEFKVTVPTHVYDISQLAFVAWIQTNSNKAVHQAAKSEPIPVENYIKLLSNNIPQLPGCYDNLDITIGVLNQGPNEITSFKIEYGVLGESLESMDWTGSLATNSTVQISLPNLSVTGLSPIIFIELLEPNGTSEYPQTHTRVEKQINLVSASTLIPLVENFTSTTFPPAGYTLINDDDQATWSRATVGGFGNVPGGSAKMDFYNSPTGQLDYLYLPALDFSGFSNVSLSFSVAYARYNAQYSDNLRVQVSVNCGETWASPFNKSGTALATAPDATSAFTPSPTQWREEIVNLDTYAGESKVLIRFRAQSGYGNNLYVDDINIDNVSSLSEQDIDAIKVYMFPNPANTNLNVIAPAKSIINIYDLLGKNVYSKISDSQETIINVHDFALGTYIINITTNEGSYTDKLIIVK